MIDLVEFKLSRDDWNINRYYSRTIYVQINFSNEFEFDSSIAVGYNMFAYTNIGNSYLNASSYIVTDVYACNCK